jgi:hypothetical protein
MQRAAEWKAPRTASLIIVAVLLLTSAAFYGCGPKSAPRVSTDGVARSQSSAVPTTTNSSQSLAPTETIAVAPGAVAPPPSVAAPKSSSAIPAQVIKFAKGFNGPAWYPTAVPKGYKSDSFDVVELEAGSGLICDVVFSSGDKSIGFTQGSPQTRDYQIVSVGKVPWGTFGSADLIYEDPEDKSSPLMIVFVSGGNFAEIYGDTGIEPLKAMAASMVSVK